MERHGDFRDLRAWQAAIELACEAHGLAGALPPTERYALASQIRRAAASVPANIAEAWGRRSRPELIRYVRVANGSLRELQSHLILCHRLELAPAASIERVLKAVDGAARLITALERGLQRLL